MVIGFDPVEGVEEERAGTGGMLLPPQALHTSTAANAIMMPRTELFTVLPPQAYGCKGDAIAKSKHSSQLAPGNGTHCAPVEDVCHYF
jgi:hypothetical protein